ncbi:hypothetical protein IscW_ISCW002126 [Ixodes scapularis]|uniref:Uncharacterized protein n=1 Tax=Ixodes scapularis TaxID=6945 RepID=B7P7U7_IXOSC|nr:hypothetical protein IscW_ISCW002126 [Ixodes scapularis]|eukprot:XP_002399718.1 hypothetical protein IscW_ISCW002126 [Ixodes scapularis]
MRFTLHNLIWSPCIVRRDHTDKLERFIQAKTIQKNRRPIPSGYFLARRGGQTTKLPNINKLNTWKNTTLGTYV